MFKELNPLLHSELRLAVMSILIGVESADFVFLRQQTGAEYVAALQTYIKR